MNKQDYYKVNVAKKQLLSAQRDRQFIYQSIGNREAEKKNLLDILDSEFDLNQLEYGYSEAKRNYFYKFNNGVSPLTREIAYLKAQLAELDKIVIPAITETIKSAFESKRDVVDRHMDRPCAKALQEISV
jgi:hypothetical protein